VTRDPMIRARHHDAAPGDGIVAPLVLPWGHNVARGRSDERAGDEEG